MDTSDFALSEGFHEILMTVMIENAQDHGGQLAKDVNPHSRICAVRHGLLDGQELPHARNIDLLQCEVVRFAEGCDVLHVNSRRTADCVVVLNCAQVQKSGGGQVVVTHDDPAKIVDELIDKGQGVLNN